jgi:hypothetical protein
MVLVAGDAVCFSPFGLHRGRYHLSPPRLTLMVTYRRADRPNYSGQPWMLEDDFFTGLSEDARVLYRAFVTEHRGAMEEERERKCEGARL